MPRWRGPFRSGNGFEPVPPRQFEARLGQVPQTGDLVVRDSAMLKPITLGTQLGLQLVDHFVGRAQGGPASELPGDAITLAFQEKRQHDLHGPEILYFGVFKWYRRFRRPRAFQNYEAARLWTLALY
jgi:hypothetical protein